MRKLVNTTIEKHLILNNKTMYQLVIENSKELYKFVTSLKNQISNKEKGPFILSKELDILDIDKELTLVTDLFNLTNIDRKIKTYLYKYVQEEMNISNLKIKFNEYITFMNQFILLIKQSIDVNVEYNDELALKDLLKAIKFVPKLNKEVFLSQILDFISFIVKLTGKDIFVFLNLSSLMSKRDMVNFVKEVQLMEVNIIDIESKYIDYSHDDIFSIIIDRELCEYYKTNDF